MKFSNRNNFRQNFSLLFLFFFFSFSFLINTQKTYAQAPSITELYGWAWSDNIGWISFNSCEVLQSGALDCGAVDYSVNVGGITGEITGTAWSDNIGWVEFGGLSSFPFGSGTVDGNAKIDMVAGNGAITGWFRACAGTISGDCSTMDPQVDGWDGWVRLSGSFHTSPDLSGNGGVTFDSANNRIIGKAWGGPVIGWIDFTDVRYGQIPPDLGPTVYTLTNSTEGSVPDIEQGAIGVISVIRTWNSGSNADVLLVPPQGLFPVGLYDDPSVFVYIDPANDNNPCEIGQEIDICSSNFMIEVLPIATEGQKSFVIFGYDGSGGPAETTQVTFNVIAPEPVPNVSCLAEGNPWLYQTIKWTATVEGETGEENYYWRDTAGIENFSICNDEENPLSICWISYTTVGTKSVEVSINGAGGPFTQCDPINIGARVFFREI